MVSSGSPQSATPANFWNPRTLFLFSSAFSDWVAMMHFGTFDSCLFVPDCEIADYLTLKYKIFMSSWDTMGRRTPNSGLSRHNPYLPNEAGDVGVLILKKI